MRPRKKIRPLEKTRVGSLKKMQLVKRCSVEKDPFAQTDPEGTMKLSMYLYHVKGRSKMGSSPSCFDAASEKDPPTQKDASQPTPKNAAGEKDAASNKIRSLKQIRMEQ